MLSSKEMARIWGLCSQRDRSDIKTDVERAATVLALADEVPHLLRTLETADTASEIMADKLQAANLQLSEAEKKGRDLCCGFGNLLLAVTAMIRHQKDKHELSSCCHDVTPTAAYKLEQAMNDLGKVIEKPVGDSCGVPCDGGEAGPYRCAFKRPCPDHDVQKRKCEPTCGHGQEHWEDNGKLFCTICSRA